MENGCSSFICILITGKQTNVHSVLVIEQSESDYNVFFCYAPTILIVYTKV